MGYPACLTAYSRHPSLGGRYARVDFAEAPWTRLAGVDADVHAGLRSGRRRRIPTGPGRKRNAMMTQALAKPAHERIRMHAPVAEYDSYLERCTDDRVYR